MPALYAASNPFWVLYASSVKVRIGTLFGEVSLSARKWVLGVVLKVVWLDRDGSTVSYTSFPYRFWLNL